MVATLQTGRRTVAALACLGLALGAGGGRATAQPARAKDRQAASALVTKANARADVGDHDGAIELYRQAYEIAPNPALLTNIGAQLIEAGKFEDALHYFCKYLDMAPTGINVSFARSKARAMQIRLGNKAVDDDNVCAPPPRPEPAPQDRIEPRQPALDVQPPLAVVHDDPIEPRRNAALSYAGIATGAAGLAALGVGVWTGIKAQQISDQISNHPMGAQWETEIKSIEARGQRYEYIQIGALIGSGALLATSAVLFVRWRASDDRPAVGIAPTRNGVAVFGRF